jgi:hypothetical protein
MRLSYNKFSLQKAVEQFDLKTEVAGDFFAGVTPRAPGALLVEILAENLPLALAIGTEKARSELIVMPVLVEVRKQMARKISIFSGIEFNVDKRLGLKGICDFLLSTSEEQYVLRSPVAAVVEAKKGEIDAGLGQCAAEMVAAQYFNAAQASGIKRIYGAVTTGNSWKFLRLQEKVLTLQADETAVEHIDRILGMFLTMLRE